VAGFKIDHRSKIIAEPKKCKCFYFYKCSFPHGVFIHNAVPW